MYLAYLDESGDAGLTNSPTRFFVLACFLVHESVWLRTLDALVAMRRNLKATHSIPTRPEIKAINVRKGAGVFKGLGWSRDRRMDLLREFLRFQPEQLQVRTFGVAIEKAPAAQRGWEPRFAAWTFALQRVNRFCVGKGEWATIYPDEGHGPFIRRRIRHMRRYHVVRGHWAPKRIEFPLERIVEDPNERASHDSYFIQLADWSAYAAHRSRYVDPKMSVPSDLWDELSGCLLMEVNQVKGGPPGIVRYP